MCLWDEEILYFVDVLELIPACALLIGFPLLHLKELEVGLPFILQLFIFLIDFLVNLPHLWVPEVAWKLLIVDAESIPLLFVKFHHNNRI